MTSLRELKQLYEKGQNICEFLRNEQNLDSNTPEIIEIAYDLQTGSYTQAMSDPMIIRHKTAYTKTIAQRILQSCDSLTSVMEAGVGEATTLSGVLRHLREETNQPRLKGYGFDLSWSRLSYAKKWLIREGLDHVEMCCGDLLSIPFCDSSIDVVYTSHSVEPNGGNEEPILRELYRVARKYLILCEPGYELGDDIAKARMDHHGYCKGLPAISRELGFDVLDHHLIDCSAIPENPSAITIIQKHGESSSTSSSVFACPKTHTPLVPGDGVLYSRESLTAYPIVAGIPCLRSENGILASRYEDIER